MVMIKRHRVFTCWALCLEKGHSPELINIDVIVSRSAIDLGQI